MQGVEVSELFICPISLQIMRDPVTTITGITYDRESIEGWLSTFPNDAAVGTCPITNQPLSKNGSDLIPNHTLRRLIQHWCTKNGVTPNSGCFDNSITVTRSYVARLIEPPLSLQTLQLLESMAEVSGRNRKLMAESDIFVSVERFIIRCFEENQRRGLREALSVLSFIRIPSMKSIQSQFTRALIWVLESEMDASMKRHALTILKWCVTRANPLLLGRLKPDFFRGVLSLLRVDNYTYISNIIILRRGLQVLFDVSVVGHNRSVMVEVGVVAGLLELELCCSSSDRRITELVFGVVFHLCRCADGREKFLSHKASASLLEKRMLVVTPAVDDRAVGIIWLLCRFVGTAAVIREMEEMGVVAKLCTMVRSKEVALNLKDKVKEILEWYSHVWRKSLCVHKSLSWNNTTTVITHAPKINQ